MTFKVFMTFGFLILSASMAMAGEGEPFFPKAKDYRCQIMHIKPQGQNTLMERFDVEGDTDTRFFSTKGIPKNGIQWKIESRTTTLVVKAVLNNKVMAQQNLNPGDKIDMSYGPADQRLVCREGSSSEMAAQYKEMFDKMNAAQAAAEKRAEEGRISRQALVNKLSGEMKSLQNQYDHLLSDAPAHTGGGFSGGTTTLPSQTGTQGTR